MQRPHDESRAHVRHVAPAFNRPHRDSIKWSLCGSDDFIEPRIRAVLGPLLLSFNRGSVKSGEFSFGSNTLAICDQSPDELIISRRKRSFPLMSPRSTRNND